MEGVEQELKIRTYIVDDGKKNEDGEEKETLVMVHGYYAAAVHFYTILNEMSKHYKVVMLD